MSFNLAEATKGLISNDLINKAGAFFGESETGTSKTVSAILPVILGGLVDKTSTADGANTIAHAATEQHQIGTLDSPGNFFEVNNEDLLNKGTGLINTIFGSKASGLTGVLSNFSGIKTSSASSLLSMIAPVVLAFLGKHASTNNLDATGLAGMLNNQKDNISNAIPAGLNLSGILGNVVVPAAKPVANPTLEQAENIEEEGKGLKLLLPLLLLVLVAAAAWYLAGNHSEPVVKTAMAADSTENVKVSATASAGHVDTSGNYIYDLGKMITIDLPNGAGKLTVGENSTENRLYKFLIDPNSKIDTVKGNWFEFTNVRFKTAGTQVDSASSAQLQNIVAISKGFPTAKFKLGGYTDNTGDTAFNISLSQKRSEAVVAALKKSGAAATAITGAQGYGPAFPIGDNTTAEGKAMNRRVAINVKSK